MKFLLWLCFCLLSTGAMAQNKAPAAKNTADAEKKIAALRVEIKTLSKAQQEVEESVIRKPSNFAKLIKKSHKAASS